MNKQEAIEKIKFQIDEPQKVVVPKFVADFYESIKDDFEDKVYDFCLQFDRDNGELSSELYEWFECVKNEPIQTLVKMKLYDYEIKQEKLYTVEIPNPNRLSLTYALYRKDDEKIIVIGAGDDYEKREEYQLTEAEIKKDFQWAWDAGFAKPVEVE